MEKRYYIGYDVLKLDIASGITYEASINWFNGNDICEKSQLFPSEEDGYRWIADIFKEWELEK